MIGPLAVSLFQRDGWWFGRRLINDGVRFQIEKRPEPDYPMDFLVATVSWQCGASIVAVLNVSLSLSFPR
ncbi:hypothetical protein BV22DRAFT_1039380 [Leucogyrophana mollusca]|uniref:Uncharacterized protein n=1 Tax=Leucogyrophana mollusca TaxID=85980 RepID=A0ACB8B4W6_9AGAM|nr:hypothetical protein BV22DRAFT_1039380 [Leucogyrophana mollusca]